MGNLGLRLPPPVRKPSPKAGAAAPPPPSPSTSRQGTAAYAFGSTPPKAGRPLLPRKLRRAASKRQRQQALKAKKDSSLSAMLARSTASSAPDAAPGSSSSSSSRTGGSSSAPASLESSGLAPYVRIDRQFKTFKPITPSLRWVRFALNPHLHPSNARVSRAMRRDELRLKQADNAKRQSAIARGLPAPTTATSSSTAAARSKVVAPGPERALTIAKRGAASSGRNHHGRITVRGRGGGVKRRLRIVDFYRWAPGEQDVLTIEYDPGRSAHIARVQHRETGRRSYILAPDGLRAGDVVRSYRADPTNPSLQGSGASSSLDLGVFRTTAIRPGNVLPLHLIPIGTQIHAISLLPRGPAKLVRSAGAAGQLVALTRRKKVPTASAAAEGSLSLAPEAEAGEYEDVDEDVTPRGDTASTTSASATLAPTHAQVKLQSGEVRLVPAQCCATIGRVSNIDHEHVRIGKAGRSRWLGRKPKVRGVAMNATDHPNGGGRGKSKSNMQAKSVYGWLAKGKRTRKPGTKKGNKMVIRERPRRNGKRLGKP